MYLTDLAEIKRIAEEEDEENVRFRQFVKYRLRWSDRRLDACVLEILARVEAAVDCTACAHCCRVLEVSLEDEDLARLGAHLGMTNAEVEAAYAKPGQGCERAFAHSPCRFLDGNRCSLYPARPRDCRDYPHIQKGEFRARMWQILAHAEDCPIVFNILRELKAFFRFR